MKVENTGTFYRYDSNTDREIWLDDRPIQIERRPFMSNDEMNRKLLKSKGS